MKIQSIGNYQAYQSKKPSFQKLVLTKEACDSLKYEPKVVHDLLDEIGKDLKACQYYDLVLGRNLKPTVKPSDDCQTDYVDSKTYESGFRRTSKTYQYNVEVAANRADSKNTIDCFRVNFRPGDYIANEEYQKLTFTETLAIAAKISKFEDERVCDKLRRNNYPEKDVKIQNLITSYGEK